MKFMFLFVLLVSLNVWAGSTSNLNQAGVLLDGYDAVSYFKRDKPIKGQSQFSVKKGDDTYWFSSQENKDLFLKEPQKYEPQFGGWCAYAVADSKSKVEIDPLSYVIQDGRLLLFYKGFWGDTRKKWLSTKDKDAASFLRDADKNWAETQKKEP